MIELRDVQVRYGKRVVLEGLSLRLPPGQVVGLLGANGVGKSSLLRLLAGLRFPSAGTVTVGGRVPGRREVPFLQDVFLIPEEIPTPAGRIGTFVRDLAPFYPAFDANEFHRYLGEFGLRETDRLSDLSYGQRKKVFIGFGLATNTRLLLLDEPTNGLDIPSKAQFRRLVAQALREDRTIVISTHQVRDLEQLIDPVLILDGKTVALHATMEEIAQRLCFETVPDVRHDTNEVLYSESTFGGFAVVREVRDGHETPVHLEGLFQATLAQPARIRALFARPLVSQTL
jgi:ABC-2 type transport system ATP-binding protein